MNIKELKEMLALMQENGLSELEIEKNGLKVRLKKAGDVIEVRKEPDQSLRPGGSAGKPSETLPHETVQDADNVVVVRSPMVGTFYAAPSPDKDPYASKGKDVKEGDVLCIIEAMKLMNEIKAELSGRVIDILIANGQPVEFDQPLFKIQKP